MTTAVLKPKREVPQPKIIDSRTNSEYRSVDFGTYRSLHVNSHGHSDEVVAAVCRQFCKAVDYGGGVLLPFETDGINEVLAAAAVPRKVAKALANLAGILDYPASLERVKAVCPFWYPVWADQYIRDEIVNAARDADEDDVWGSWGVKINVSKIHEKLVDRIWDEYQHLFDETPVSE